jgi:hypothetical protein
MITAIRLVIVRVLRKAPTKKNVDKNETQK